MSDNPYAAPSAELELAPDESTIELATRFSRFLGAVVDGVIGAIVAVPFFILVGPTFGFEFGQQPGMTFNILATIYGFILFALIQSYFLKANGQTIGKKLTGIKIVSTQHADVSVGEILGMRYLPISLITMLPIVGQILPLVDALFIFKKDRRCIHDMIAGTCVIKCPDSTAAKNRR